jgi:hypothetical protein
MDFLIAAELSLEAVLSTCWVLVAYSLLASEPHDADIKTMMKHEAIRINWSRINIFNQLYLQKQTHYKRSC